jgi:dsDNA-specific endonuclease/ATPase MutS2
VELSDADNKFTTQIKAALQPLLDLKRSFESKIKHISSAIEQLAKHTNAVLQNIEDLLTGFEQALKATFEQLLKQIRQCKDTAKLTVSKSNNEQLSKLQASLVDTHTTAHNIQQKTVDIEQYLAPTSTVFDKLQVVKQLPDITKQTTSDFSTVYQVCDMRKWESEMKTWCQSITNKLASATTSIHQLSDASLAVTR